MNTQVAAIAMHSVMGDVDSNLSRISDWMQKAYTGGASFAVFNEECITGSMNKSDLTFSQAMKIAKQASAKSMPFLESLCRDLNMTAIVGTIEPAGERFLNSALIVGPNGYLTTYSKLHLPNQTEKEWFKVGSHLPVVTSQGWTFGVGICYDLSFPEIFRSAAQHGAELFFIPVGGGFDTAVGGSRIFEKFPEILRTGDQSRQARSDVEGVMRLLPSRSIDNGMYVFSANQAGHSGNAWFPGYCIAVAPDGYVVGKHDTGEEGMILVEVSKRAVENAKDSINSTVRPDVYAAPIIVDSPER